MGEDAGLAEIHKLYRCHDRLLVHKQALFDHLVGRWRDLFNISYDVLLYDLTSRFVARINSRARSAPRSDIYVRRTYSGRPSSSMRFSEAAAMATSVVCRPPVRERSASPITRL